MDGDTGRERSSSTDSCAAPHEASPFRQIRCAPTLELSRGEALILVLLLSLGLWAALWTALSLSAHWVLR